MRRKLYVLAFVFILCSAARIIADPSVRVVDNPWLVLRAFLVSYPDKISGVDYDANLGDWFLTIGGERLYWADGRLLPLAEIGNREKWRPYVDYFYPEAIPDPASFSADTIERLNARMLAETRSTSPVYHTRFYDLLYGGGSRAKIETQITRFDYMGTRVSVNDYIAPALKRVESRLNILAERNVEVRLFISSILSIEGYNWRKIADTPSRSNHSWGIAVDILPKNWGKKNIYWNWVSYWNDKWMLIPLDRRWIPPAPVIAAFEEEGFIWGGKWLLWDNMHFEYRPELMTLKKWGYKGDLKE